MQPINYVLCAQLHVVAVAASCLDQCSFLKQQVFPGSLDHDMATFVDTMGLELLQQSAR